MQKARHCMSAPGSRDIWWLACRCWERGQEAWRRPCKAHGAGGGQGYLPPVEQDEHSSPARKCCSFGQKVASPTRTSYWWHYVNCNSSKLWFRVFPCTVSQWWSMCALPGNISLYQHPGVLWAISPDTQISVRLIHTTDWRKKWRKLKVKNLPFWDDIHSQGNF